MSGGNCRQDSKKSRTRKKLLFLLQSWKRKLEPLEERPLIAGVFLNRLQMGMRLQSDPTVDLRQQEIFTVYLKSDLHALTPYNTYTRSGLPIGPIAIQAKKHLRLFYILPRPMPLFRLKK